MRPRRIVPVGAAVVCALMVAGCQPNGTHRNEAMDHVSLALTDGQVSDLLGVGLRPFGDGLLEEDRLGRWSHRPYEVPFCVEMSRLTTQHVMDDSDGGVAVRYYPSVGEPFYPVMVLMAIGEGTVFKAGSDGTVKNFMELAGKWTDQRALEWWDLTVGEFLSGGFAEQAERSWEGQCGDPTYLVAQRIEGLPEGVVGYREVDFGPVPGEPRLEALPPDTPLNSLSSGGGWAVTLFTTVDDKWSVVVGMHYSGLEVGIDDLDLLPVLEATVAKVRQNGQAVLDGAKAPSVEKALAYLRDDLGWLLGCGIS